MNTSVIPAPVALLISAGLLPLVAGTQGSDPGRGLERDNAGGGKLEGAWNVTVNIWCEAGSYTSFMRWKCFPRNVTPDFLQYTGERPEMSSQ